MELKKVIALTVAGLSFTCVGVLSVSATTYGTGTENTSWTYGKNTSTTAISDLLDKVATHDSLVENESTGATSATVTATAGTISYAKVAASSSNSMLYYCSDFAVVGPTTK